jgi:hypothetical protein
MARLKIDSGRLRKEHRELMKTCWMGFGLALAAAIPARAADPVPVAVRAGLGCDEVFAKHDRNAVYLLELEFAEIGSGWAPAIEASVNSREAFFFGAGLVWRWESGSPFGLRAGLAPGYYDRGGGKDLGGHFQIESFVEATWRLGAFQQAGLRLAHFSNAGLERINPGTEALAVTYSVRWR